MENAPPNILSGNWNYPTAMRFGAGRIVELPDDCKLLGMTKPLLVTDPGIAGLPMIADAIKNCEAAGLPTAVFSDIKPNPVGANVEAGVEVFKAGGHDGVIAFGGGSALDAAKAVALMAGQSRPIWDFEDLGDNWKRVDETNLIPVVAVPTTAGTGSEVGRSSVITNEDTHTKTIIFHPSMLPRIVISDPELTVGLPAHITAATGIDAFVHCFEAYCATGYHPKADGIAVEGMRLIKTWLHVAVEDGTNIEARSHMLAAASMGATAFQKNLGAVHSLAHPVGALLDVHHGLANAVFLPYVMAFNKPAIAEKMDALAPYLGIEGGFDGVLKWVLDWRKALGIPHTATEIGVTEDRLDELAEMAANDPTAGGNPRPVGVKEMHQMYEAALKGKV